MQTDRPAAPAHVVLLRGINVVGRNKLAMRDFRTLLGALGLDHVVTYIQSGNAVFRCPTGRAVGLAGQIREAVRRHAGFAPEVIVLNEAQLADAIRHNPFPTADEEPTHVHLTFLAARPERPDRERMQAIARASERFRLRASVFYLYAPEGLGSSKLASRLERLLGVAGTSRNWRTVTALRDLAASLSRSS